MTAPAAVRGTFADLKFIKSRSVVQIIVEAPIEEGAAVVAAFGTPQPGSEVHVAVARINPEAVKPAPERERKPWAEMPRSQQAGIRCNEEAFSEFLRERYDQTFEGAGEDAAIALRILCQVFSRRELDNPQNVESRKVWDAIDEQYRAWLDAPKYGAA